MNAKPWAFCIAMASAAGLGYWAGASRDAPDPRNLPVVCEQNTPGVKHARMCTHNETARVRKALREVVLLIPAPLTMNQRAAFASFMLDTDKGHFSRSVLLQKFNRGDVPGACDEMLHWDKLNGIVDHHKTRRRQLERDLCMTKG